MGISRRSSDRALPLRQRPFLFLGAPLGIAALLFAGCNDDNVTLDPFAPTVLAVSAPDSIPAGQPLSVLVHWRQSNSCQQLEDLEFNQVQDTVYTLAVVGVERREGSTQCTDETRIVESEIEFSNPPSGRFVLEVTGAAERFVLPVHAGTAPAAIQRHVVEVESSVTSQPLPGVDVSFRFSGGDTLGPIVTDAMGIADTAITCPGSARFYFTRVLGPLNRMIELPFTDAPARCGVPNRTQVRL